MAKESAAERAAKVEQIELDVVTVRAVNEGGAEVRFGDEQGQVSLVYRKKTMGRKLEKGMKGRLVFIPDAEATKQNMVTVELPAEDTGGLPGSAREVKRDE